LGSKGSGGAHHLRSKWLLQYAALLGDLKYTQREIQAALRLDEAARQVSVDPVTGKPTSEPAVDAASAALTRADALMRRRIARDAPNVETALEERRKALEEGYGDVGHPEKPTFRTGARYAKAGKRHVESLPAAFRELLEQNLAVRGRVLDIARRQKALRQRLGRDLTDAEIRSTLRARPQRRRSKKPPK